jgi:hypothetical protein
VSNAGRVVPVPAVPTAWKMLVASEPSQVLARQIITGGLHCPGSPQRHQATFSLVALFAFRSGLFQCWNLTRRQGAKPAELVVGAHGLHRERCGQDDNDLHQGSRRKHGCE